MADLTLRLVKGSPLTNAEVDNNFSSLNDAVTAAGEPMGHVNNADSALSFDASTRTVTISPTGAAFVVWCKTAKYTFTTPQSVVIPDTTGLHYVYFNTVGVLSTRTTFFDWPNDAPTAYVAWNAATQAAPFFADERHGITLDWQTHEYLHRTRGAALANGFGISNYTITGSGSSDADAQFDLSGGTFFDEDLQVDVTHSNSPTPNTWQQDLAGPAQIPVLYRSGSGWVRDNPTNFVLKAGTATPRYNTESGGVWGLTDVPNNSYSSVWVLATNNLTYPVVAIMGQYASNNESEAESFDWGELNLDGFPSIEFRPLYKIVFQCSSSYGNTIKARFTNVFDIRNLVSSSPAATIGSSHGGLSGLGGDDHLQYVHISEVRTPSDAVKASFLPSQTGNNGKYLQTNGTVPSWATLTNPNNGTLTMAVSGTGLSGSASFTADQAGNSTFTVTSNATSVNNSNTVVARDSSGNFSAGTVTATLSGNATTATTLQTARTIGGVSFNGSANINLPGVNTAGNQNTSGNAATATALATARAINGVDFNGTAAITITANTTNALTLGTGLTGSSFNGSSAVTAAVSYGTTSGTACQGNDSRLSDARQATNSNTQLASLGVGTAASGTAGEIRATNNITAYFSDDRLKTRLGNIENALDKVRTLSGFYYQPNEAAQALGYEVKREVGVSAQQVQAVQPEVVAPAPIDDKYLTVRYEKLVPLLIEAIKELDAGIQSIKAQLKG